MSKAMRDSNRASMEARWLVKENLENKRIKRQMFWEGVWQKLSIPLMFIIVFIVLFAGCSTWQAILRWINPNFY